METAGQLTINLQTQIMHKTATQTSDTAVCQINLDFTQFKYLLFKKEGTLYEFHSVSHNTELCSWASKLGPAQTNIEREVLANYGCKQKYAAVSTVKTDTAAIFAGSQNTAYIPPWVLDSFLPWCQIVLNQYIVW